MELYIYSAQKNRETLLRAVPVDAVVEVKIAAQGAMTPYQAKRVYNTEFDKLELAKERKQTREQAEAKKQAEIAAAQKGRRRVRNRSATARSRPHWRSRQLEIPRSSGR